MSSERFFVLLSIALIGAATLAYGPENLLEKNSSFVEAEVESRSEIGRSDGQVDSADVDTLEITSVRDVDEINAGEFKPYEIGSHDPSGLEKELR